LTFPDTPRIGIGGRHEVAHLRRVERECDGHSARSFHRLMDITPQDYRARFGS
jgi:hypothetical protein